MKAGQIVGPLPLAYVCTLLDANLIRHPLSEGSDYNFRSGRLSICLESLGFEAE